MALVNGTTSLLMFDGIETLDRVDDLDRRTDADAVDDSGHAPALFIAAFRPHVIVLILASVDFAHAVAGTFPDGATLIRFGDFDRVGTTGRRSYVRFGAHADAFDATVDAQTPFIASVVPSVAFRVLHILVDAGLGYVLAFVDRTALAVGDVAHGDAAVGAWRSQRSRAALSAVDFTRATVTTQFAAVVEDLLVLVLLAFVGARQEFLADLRMEK